jgi:hypothetical protein
MKLLKAQSAIAGAFFFFSLSELITRVFMAVKGLGKEPMSESHPPPKARMEVTTMFYKDKAQLPVRLFELSDVYGQWIEKSTERVVDRVDSILSKK